MTFAYIALAGALLFVLAGILFAWRTSRRVRVLHSRVDAQTAHEAAEAAIPRGVKVARIERGHGHTAVVLMRVCAGEEHVSLRLPCDERTAHEMVEWWERDTRPSGDGH